MKTNWQRFTALLSSRIINVFMKPLTDEKRKDVFIIDDSLFDRSHSKKAELLAKVFDHYSMKFKKGFRLLTLGWSDGILLSLSITACSLRQKTKTCSAVPKALAAVPLPEDAAATPESDRCHAGTDSDCTCCWAFPDVLWLSDHLFVAVTFLVHRNTLSLGVGKRCVYILGRTALL
ncbi:hypothetical protein [Enterocloster clostridioformis]|nr:hypothetical protein [Enterocloster clostridioformis]MCI6125327.1 hypothetical protein [Enterocloster clostridioformis]NSD57271.1 hypothetical protein [Enterocloster clostridioformis]NSJ11287.1 hypothetical protein [Enterocloster clostridioformis]NSJ19825.1 hypothetical protein [Enterocloster clostridioformis]NSJ32006.1 hypothetical protein [Enterocloster clostridioformis]